jgi:hypothetical protein
MADLRGWAISTYRSCHVLAGVGRALGEVPLGFKVESILPSTTAPTSIHPIFDTTLRPIYHAASLDGLCAGVVAAATGRFMIVTIIRR